MHVAVAHAGGLDARGRANAAVRQAGVLIEPEIGALHFSRNHRNGEQVIQARADLVVDLGAHHHETDPFDSGEALLVHAQAAQPFAARALEVAQVVGIVDNAADVHVLVIDAHLPGERLRPVWLSLHRRIVACAMLDGMAVVAHLLARDGQIPNHPHWPLLVYNGAVASSGLDPAGSDLAALFEALFTRNRWPAAWRNGIHPFHHYHSNGHEALGIYSGGVSVQFGGDAGVTVTAKPGDVIVLPAGTGHKKLSSKGALGVVGAYPDGQHPDTR